MRAETLEAILAGVKEPATAPSKNSPWPADDTILSTLQASEMMGCHRATLEKLHRLGQGPPRIRITDRRIGYRLGDLRQWLQSRVLT
jgi:predicted DNA-binding transcriptional regulator AlpA